MLTENYQKILYKFTSHAEWPRFFFSLINGFTYFQKFIAMITKSFFFFWFKWKCAIIVQYKRQCWINVPKVNSKLFVTIAFNTCWNESSMIFYDWINSFDFDDFLKIFLYHQIQISLNKFFSFSLKVYFWSKFFKSTGYFLHINLIKIFYNIPSNSIRREIRQLNNFSCSFNNSFYPSEYFKATKIMKNK